MSKLLLSTSLVVALMASGAALYADEPDPELSQITLDQDAQNDITKAEDAAKKVEDTASDQENTVNETDTTVVQDTTSLLNNKLLGQKLSPEAKAAIRDKLNKLEEQHAVFDSAVTAAAQESDSTDQATNFVAVEDAAGDVKEAAQDLANELEKVGETSDASYNAAEALVGEAGNEVKDEKHVATDDTALEKDTSVDQAAIEKDAALSDQDERDIADDLLKGDLKTNTKKVMDSLTAAEEIKDGLKAAGLDPKDEQLQELSAALKNLKSILDKMLPDQAKRVVPTATTKK